MRILSYPPLIQHLNFSKSERPSWWTHLQSSSSELSWAPQFRTWLHTSDLNAATIFFFIIRMQMIFLKTRKRKGYTAKLSETYVIRTDEVDMSLKDIFFFYLNNFKSWVISKFPPPAMKIKSWLSSFSLAWCLWRQSDNGFRFSINSSLSDISSQRTFVSLIPEVIHWKEQIFTETYHQRGEI